MVSINNKIKTNLATIAQLPFHVVEVQFTSITQLQFAFVLEFNMWVLSFKPKRHVTVCALAQIAS